MSANEFAKQYYERLMMRKAKEVNGKETTTKQKTPQRTPRASTKSGAGASHDFAKQYYDRLVEKKKKTATMTGMETTSPAALVLKSPPKTPTQRASKTSSHERAQQYYNRLVADQDGKETASPAVLVHKPPPKSQPTQRASKTAVAARDYSKQYHGRLVAEKKTETAGPTALVRKSPPHSHRNPTSDHQSEKVAAVMNTKRAMSKQQRDLERAQTWYLKKLTDETNSMDDVSDDDDDEEDESLDYEMVEAADFQQLEADDGSLGTDQKPAFIHIPTVDVSPPILEQPYHHYRDEDVEMEEVNAVAAQAVGTEHSSPRTTKVIIEFTTCFARGEEENQDEGQQPSHRVIISTDPPGSKIYTSSEYRQNF